MQTKLIVIRHGETDWNPIHRIQGWIDTDLNDNGIRQMEELAGRLNNEKIDVIYTSVLKRGYRSAEIINRCHNAPVIKEKDLSELNQGEWQGQLVSELEIRFEAYRRWQKNPMDVTPPGGEHITRFADNVIRKMKEIINGYRGKNICVVSHEVTNAVLRCYFNNIDLSHIWNHCPANTDIDVYELP
jgi:broad specificity phosphatase PhoE